MAIVLRGEREISARFEQFPAFARKRLLERIKDLTQRLAGAVQSAAPERTGRLRSEISTRVFEDRPGRLAGYVSVFAPGVAGELAKAATLEYGSNKARSVFDRSQMIMTKRGKMRPTPVGSTKIAHIQAYRYLRGPLKAMEPQVRAALADALTQAIADAQGEG